MPTIGLIFDLHADKIEVAFAPYVKAAEKVSSAGKARAKTSSATKPSGSSRSAEKLKAVREWAGKNGFDVSPPWKGQSRRHRCFRRRALRLVNSFVVC
ncbi:Lsr2 family protein [Rhodococcus sp. ARC_M13]|uniref:Lsr2 dimerization domain-containing protein n=1 Tax=Rhodococcus TaxID=1827 RepID=UPI001CD91AA2|nr:MULTISPECIES: histone-like nucleoid-structuring protein Lsr2 [Rhodococcus]MCJ0897754.1 Lsr2 family protein [Rhodococcus sp. ARC_M13]UKO86459.1 Lsr2 family protein [Rhodococcus erythropolis]